MPSAQQQEAFVPNDVWATSTPTDSSEDLTLPSGQTCRAKRLGLEGVMTSGILGEADSLTAYVGRQHVDRVRKGNGSTEEKLNASSVLKDPEALKAIVFLVDRAVPLIVETPPVQSHFVPDGDTTRMLSAAEREDGVIYTDRIPLEDKMFLFNFSIGGSRSLEQFRSATDSVVAGLDSVESLPSKPKRTVERKSRSARR